MKEIEELTEPKVKTWVFLLIKFITGFAVGSLIVYLVILIRG